MNTAMKDPMFATTLAAILRERGVDVIYPCVRDLLENGLTLARFSDGEFKPQRQDITQYMAAWSKHVGLGEEECRSWLIEYCVAMLSPISRTSPSGIRHSTKSNIKYVYRSDVPFSCEHEDNSFRAQCSKDCPAYAAMIPNACGGRNETSKESALARPADVVEAQVISVKAIYRDQFEIALRFIHDETKKKIKKKRIVQLLNEQGLKTRTGRRWTYSILHSELTKIKGNQVADTPNQSMDTDAE